ncbi:hypothetical protein [Diaphorobacter aerolatus]|uniref:Uncharacterized protein n=1 Tax=Diaphorobacter aerolatus TaxID=1288495 RepID=A0A7H0GQX8_9BURK|nr:hypothetical protein [Diaphorobacter aerolatus]QNP50694.1 hypothetical protein H9K75_09760 [Diaphorobacter aerolatus]
MLAQAPHRLSFFLAMTGLIASGVGWALVQWDRTACRRPVFSMEDSREQQNLAARRALARRRL